MLDAVAQYRIAALSEIRVEIDIVLSFVQTVPSVNLRSDGLERSARHWFLMYHCDRRLLAAPDTGSRDHSHTGAEKIGQPLEQLLGAGDSARKIVVLGGGNP